MLSRNTGFLIGTRLSGGGTRPPLSSETLKLLLPPEYNPNITIKLTLQSLFFAFLENLAKANFSKEQETAPAPSNRR